MIDGDNVGITGQSYGGYTALAIAGTQVDSDYFARWYRNNLNSTGILDIDFTLYITDADFDTAWSGISDYAANFFTLQEGDMWPPMTDERIKAVLPFVPGLIPMFGPEGLDAVTKPTLIFSATQDQYIPYSEQIIPELSGWLGDNRHLITMVDSVHQPEYTSLGATYYKHFSVAWFGYQLQGNEDFAAYISKDFIGNFADLAWGIYTDE
jgi:predicted dienelactone hydrolase